MATEYKITVERIETDVPYTETEYKIVSDTGENDNRDRKYGYVETEKTQDVTTKVFEQNLDKLDLAELVLVINKKKEQ